MGGDGMGRQDPPWGQRLFRAGRAHWPFRPLCDASWQDLVCQGDGHLAVAGLVAGLVVLIGPVVVGSAAATISAAVSTGPSGIAAASAGAIAAAMGATATATEPAVGPCAVDI